MCSGSFLWTFLNHTSIKTHFVNWANFWFRVQWHDDSMFAHRNLLNPLSTKQGSSCRTLRRAVVDKSLSEPCVVLWIVVFLFFKRLVNCRVTLNLRAVRPISSPPPVPISPIILLTTARSAVYILRFYQSSLLTPSWAQRELWKACNQVSSSPSCWPHLLSAVCPFWGTLLVRLCFSFWVFLFESTL